MFEIIAEFSTSRMSIYVCLLASRNCTHTVPALNYSFPCSHAGSDPTSAVYAYNVFACVHIEPVVHATSYRSTTPTSHVAAPFERNASSGRYARDL